MKQERLLMAFLCVACLIISSFGMIAPTAKAQESETIATKLSEAMDFYTIGKFSDGLKITQNLLEREDLLSVDSIAIYEVMSLLTYSKGEDYLNLSIDYLNKISNIGPCLIRLPREIWPQELRDKWNKLQYGSDGFLCSQETRSDVKSIAFMEFDNNSVGKYQEKLGPLGKGLAELFAHYFRNISSFTVIERDKINVVLKELELQKSGTVDRSTAVRVGKIIGAQYMVFGSIMQLDDDNSIMLVRVVDVETSEIIESIDKEGKPKYVKAVKELVEELSGKLDVVLSDEVKKLIQKEGTDSDNAVTLYSKGLEYMDRYEYQKAYDYFKQAYELDNDFVEAKRKMDIYQPLTKG
ncbi:MAG: CsgG/HfaB family protein [candidate division Zixibacteria bacterium]|nr:CsgG/HfaB family protein [candidate division Zixibacteria bacterium]